MLSYTRIMRKGGSLNHSLRQSLAQACETIFGDDCHGTKLLIRNSVLVLMPYLLGAMVCGLIFGHFLVFLSLAILAFAFTQLIQMHHFQRWCIDESTPVPSVGLNRIWKSIYFSFETRLPDKISKTVLDVGELQSTANGDYGLIVLSARHIVWINRRAIELLELDDARAKGSDISYWVRAPNFLDALDEKRYAQEIVLENRHPPVAICLLPCATQYLYVLVRDLSHFMSIQRTNQELFANMAHELRSPLTVLYGYLDILKDIAASSTDQDLKKVADNMQTHITRMKVLTDNVLNIASLESTELDEREQSSVDVPAILESIVASFKTDQQPCRFDMHIENFQLRGSDAELYSVFYNLIDNAVCHSQSDSIKIVWRQDAQGAYFEVIDSGIGIDTSHLSKLTRRFYRVDEARSGARNIGLGLSIVKHVVYRHQATLEIESELGKGSTFRCCFPSSRVIERDTQN